MGVPVGSPVVRGSHRSGGAPESPRGFPRDSGGSGVCLTQPPGAEAGVGAGGQPGLVPLQDVLHQLLQGQPGGRPPIPTAPLHPVDCRRGGKVPQEGVCVIHCLSSPPRSATHAPTPLQPAGNFSSRGFGVSSPCPHNSPSATSSHRKREAKSHNWGAASPSLAPLYAVNFEKGDYKSIKKGDLGCPSHNPTPLWNRLWGSPHSHMGRSWATSSSCDHLSHSRGSAAAAQSGGAPAQSGGLQSGGAQGRPHSSMAGTFR